MSIKDETNTDFLYETKTNSLYDDSGSDGLG